MTDAAKKARAEYIRQWRKKNPDKMKQYNENHWERVAAQQAAKEAENTDTETTEK